MSKIRTQKGHARTLYPIPSFSPYSNLSFCIFADFTSDASAPLFFVILENSFPFPATTTIGNLRLFSTQKSHPSIVVYTPKYI